MPLPERPHLYLDEVAEQLGVSLRDIENYLMQGKLRASIWLLPTFVEMSIFELHHKGIYEPFDQRWYEGYVELSPVTCRKLLVSGQTEERTASGRCMASKKLCQILCLPPVVLPSCLIFWLNISGGHVCIAPLKQTAMKHAPCETGPWHDLPAIPFPRRKPFVTV